MLACLRTSTLYCCRPLKPVIPVFCPFASYNLELLNLYRYAKPSTTMSLYLLPDRSVNL